MSQNKWFLVEGNIGSGKTTLLEKLNLNENYEVIREPVNLWLSIKGSDGKNLLQEFYEEPIRYAYLFQTMVFKTRLESLEQEQTKTFRFSERSIWTDRFVFGKSCINSNKMNELETNCYHFWFDWLETKFFKKPDGIIYLRCSPEKCLERMKIRARNEENGVPLEYLKELHNYHEEWFDAWEKKDESFSKMHSEAIKQVPVLIIDNEKDNDWEQVMEQVNNFIK